MSYVPGTPGQYQSVPDLQYFVQTELQRIADALEGVMTLPNGVQVLSGSGDPNGNETAPQGSLFLRTDGAAATSIYVNTNGVSAWSAR